MQEPPTPSSQTLGSFKSIMSSTLEKPSQSLFLLDFYGLKVNRLIVLYALNLFVKFPMAPSKSGRKSVRNSTVTGHGESYHFLKSWARSVPMRSISARIAYNNTSKSNCSNSGEAHATISRVHPWAVNAYLHMKNYGCTRKKRHSRSKLCPTYGR
jgi:hypothetical protein